MKTRTKKTKTTPSKGRDLWAIIAESGEEITVCEDSAMSALAAVEAINQGDTPLPPTFALENIIKVELIARIDVMT